MNLEAGKIVMVFCKEFDDKKYRIDKILDRGPAACRSVGGVGVKYTCVVLGKVTELWEEKEQWFVVAKG